MLHGGRRLWDRLYDWRAHAQAADSKVLLESIGLQEIGELEDSDISTRGPVLALEISHHVLDIGQRVAGAQAILEILGQLRSG
jgi:hypothetical protein